MFLLEEGWDVTLIGRKLKASQPLERPYATHRFNLFFKKGAGFYASYNLRLFLFLIFRRYDAIVSNDLDTLLACYLASLTKSGCQLFYDSHELFTEVPELIHRPKVRTTWLAIEKWVFPKLKKVYTVNESIARIYREKYQVPVAVVRNVSQRWIPEKIKSREELGLPNNKSIVILQGAGINMDRGAEEAIEAMKLLSDKVLFLIIGSGDVIPLLQSRVVHDGMTEKVKFLGKMPYQEMMNYTFHADIGLSLDKNTNANYQFSLPNKLFDYMHTETVIVASDLPEVANIVKKHNIGKIVPNHDPSVIAATISALLQDQALMLLMKSNCVEAAKIENWEKEKEVLRLMYAE